MDNFKKQLKQGDIIMHHAHGWLSSIIRNFDQSHYNHCSIYDKDDFLYESVNGGVKRKKIQESIATQKTALISIFRLEGIPQEKTHLLINNIEEKYRENSYAYSQVLLLASLLLKRKHNIKGVLGKCINLLALGFEKTIMLFFDRSDKNLMCSELIYRTYMDVCHQEKNKIFSLNIPLECSPIFELESDANKLKFPCDINKLNEIKLNKTKENRSLKKTFNFSGKLKKAKLYNFITPGDLVRCLNLYEIATYKTEYTRNFTKCEICKS